MALDDIVRRVRTEFTVDERGAMRSARDIQSTFGSVAKVADKTRAIVGSILSPVVSGGVSLVKHLVEVGREAESSELQLTSMLLKSEKFTSLTIGGFGNARDAAKELDAEFARLGKAGGLSAEDIRGAFSSLTVELSKSGFTLRQQAEIASDVARRQKIESPRKGDQVARDTANALREVRKEAGKLESQGKESEAFELMNNEIAKIREGLKLSTEEVAGFGGTFEGKLAVAEDAFGKLKRVAAEPLMNFLVEKLDEFTGILSEDEEKSKAIAREWGENITSALEAVFEIAGFILNNFETIVDVAIALGTIWIGSVIVGALAKAAAGAAALFGWLVKARAVAATMGGVSGGGASGFGLGGAAKGGLLGAALKGAGAAGAGLFIGDLIGSPISNAVSGFKGGLTDVLSGNFEFDEDPANVANRKRFADSEFGREAARRTAAGTEAKAVKERGVLDQKIAKVIEEDRKKKRGRGGGGSRDLKIDRATINIGNADIAGDTFARLASPLVLQLFDAAGGQRPISAEAGLSAIPLANGAGPGVM